MKIGDIVNNPYAGKGNPYKISMFIGWSGKYRKCLCSDGHISKYDKDINLEVVDHIPFKDQLEKLNKDLLK